MKSLAAFGALALPVASLLALSGAQAKAPAYCDRACLIKLTDQYVAALAAHDPKKAPLAADLGFVENLKRLKAGEGLWKTTTAGPTAFQIHIPDTDMQSAAWMGMLQQEGKPVLVAVRLKVFDGKITEAEHLVSAVGEASLANVQKPRPGLVTEVPVPGRLPHDQLMRIGIQYYDALDDNMGAKMPFAADCERRENGMTTAGANAGPGPNADPKIPPVARECGPQLDSNSFEYIKYINNRRIVAADPVTGLAIGFSQLRHPFDNLPYMVKHSNGMFTQRNAENMKFNPFDMPAAHIFKIGADHKVHEIEAVGFVAPYNSPTGWEQ